MTAQGFRPLSLRRIGETGLLIEWSDGHRSEYTWRWLRDHCPCASCREERQLAGGKAQSSSEAQPPKTATGKIPLASVRAGEVSGSPYQAVSVTPVGRYAYKIVWADGHDSGIYSLEWLRQLCQCPQCQGRLAS